MRHADRRNDDDRRQDIRQNFLEHDVAARGAKRTRRLDILQLAGGQRLAAHHAARDHPFLVGQRHDDIPQSGPHHRHQADCKDKVRKAQQDIDDTRNHHVDPTAQVTRCKSGENTDGRCHQNDGGADEDRNSGAVDYAGQDIAAQRVAPQNIAPVAAVDPCGRLQAQKQIGLVRIMRRDQRREDRHHHEQKHDNGTAHGKSVLRKVAQITAKYGFFRLLRNVDSQAHSFTLGFRYVYRMSAVKFSST